jgi:RES domain-containing protein
MSRKLPIASPEQILDAIERWRAVDLSGASDAEIESAIARFLAQIEPYPRFRTELSKEVTFYRVRRCDGCNPWPPRTVAGLLYVPNPTSYGRCHVPGTPTLYASKSAGTCLPECRVQEGEELLLIEYQVRAPILARVPGELDLAEEEYRAERYDDEGMRSYRMLRDFLREEFTQPTSEGCSRPYKISSAICRAWLEPSLDGWIYPSVQSPLEECVAFRRRYVDSDAFRIVGAQHCTVLAVRNTDYELGWLQSYKVRPKPALIDGRIRTYFDTDLPKLTANTELRWDPASPAWRFDVLESPQQGEGFRFRVHGHAVSQDLDPPNS